ncbi:MAG: hypothetical protein CEO12_182 [Parcubacteria group bacterium Gr01-1014_46]|nr:MAG: hypothetical protein CEO12_182 [Parcubacteria group bacterium Gr01-1014_46]
MSLGVVVFVAAMAITATGAFFSDSETSVGNVLAAGAIDLQIDNTSYVTSTSTGQLVASPWTTWTMRDLTIEKFFDFSDLKPGDIGEDTISLHVDNNDSYLCADVTLTSNNENTLVEPEAEDGDITNDPNGGELAQQVNFAWWADDGDNVLETGENLLQGGPLGALAIGATTTVTLADSVYNIWTLQGGPVPGASVRYVGKAWCFGTITPNPVAQDNGADVGRSPLTVGTGFTCDGSQVGNTAQTDSLTANVAFRAVQSRNNGNFQCVQRQGEPTTGTLTVTKVVTNDNGGTAVVGGFPLFVDSMSISSGVATTTSAGLHTVSESGLFGYSATFSGDCASDGTVNVPAGGAASCTITNDDIQPVVTLIKNVVGGESAPDDFDLSIDSGIVTSGSSNGVSANASHELDEEVLVAGYSQTSVTGTSFLGVSCPASFPGSVVLTPGDTITCTVTNTFD